MSDEVDKLIRYWADRAHAHAARVREVEMLSAEIDTRRLAAEARVAELERGIEGRDQKIREQKDEVCALHEQRRTLEARVAELEHKLSAVRENCRGAYNYIATGLKDLEEL